MKIILDEADIKKAIITDIEEKGLTLEGEIVLQCSEKGEITAEFKVIE